MCVIIDLWYSSLIFACIRKKGEKSRRKESKASEQHSDNNTKPCRRAPSKVETSTRLCPRNNETPTGHMEKVGNEVYQAHLHMQWHSPNVPPKCHFLKLRSSSSEPSGPTSYGIGRIKSHQVRVMSPVLLIRVSRDVSRVPTIVHASPRKNHREVVCVRAIPRKDPAYGRGAPLQHVALSNGPVRPLVCAQ